MYVVDANVLLYSVNTAEEKHEASRRWLDGALSANEPVGFAWTVVLAFLRLSTKIGLYPRPLPLDQAVSQVRSWLEQPPSIVLEPSRRHLALLAGLLGSTGAGGNLVNDAHLAVLALEHDATVITFDTDFSRFDGLRWRPPS
ncbi:MAG: type II toxin-antitoxin system VapC family toxin [Actinomycetota bacterium]